MSRNHRFGQIEARLAERLLLIDGNVAALGARAFDVLQALIQHRDRVVTKNELLEMVWPGMVVEENNLQLQVSTLRKLLGHHAVATIPGRGYQFTLGEDPAAPTAFTTNQIERRASRVSPTVNVVDPSHVASASASATIVNPATTIAVLPFINLSADEAGGFFADGLAEEILNVVAKINGLRVAARTSSSTFKGKNATIAEVGRVLGVSKVLEGSVRKAADRIRVSVQLVNVADGYDLWSESYDRTLDDVFAVQDDITFRVVTELRRALLGELPGVTLRGAVEADVTASAKGRGKSVEAHQMFIQGRYLTDRLSLVDMKKGLELLRQAIALDPGHAQAFATLSRSLSLLMAYGHIPFEGACAEAIRLANHALTLEPELADGHIALGTALMFDNWNWREAEAHFLSARETAPNSADVLRSFGYLAHVHGRIDEAVMYFGQACEVDPLAIRGYGHYGRSLRAAGKVTEAETVYRRGLELSPQAAGFQMMLAWLLLAQQRPDEALATAELDAAPWARLCGLATIHHALGHANEAEAARAELEAGFASSAGFQLAIIHATRGEKADAFRWLDRGLAQREYSMSLAKGEPYFQSLHGDKRWKPFLKKIGVAA